MHGRSRNILIQFFHINVQHIRSNMMFIFYVGLFLLECMVWAYGDQCIFQPRSQSVNFLRKTQLMLNHEEHDAFKLQTESRQVSYQEGTHRDRNVSKRKSGPILRINLYRTRNVLACSSSPCEHGRCTDKDRLFTCTCQSGWRGTTCNIDINECASNPCQHGSCNDHENSYSCTCGVGYEGKYCEIDTDECTSNPCKYGSCIDHVNHYSCTCVDGYEGKNCEIDTDECASNPCKYGSCNNHVNHYTCTCRDGYEGKNCELDIDECASNPCEHGSCYDHVNHYNCTCGDGYEGNNCEIDTDDCASNPCRYGSCNDHVNHYTCTCGDGYIGTNCETDIDECASNPCKYGSCNDHVNHYTCNCGDGYVGTNCDIDIDECASNPCKYGSCNDHVNHYSCTCRGGYKGSNCDIDIDECASNPCKYGSCNDHVNHYSCTCDDGYVGNNCEIDTDECASNPCQHGSCYDHVNRYVCSCDLGYGGTNCNIDVDECNSSPCLNDASCNDHVNSYSCSCSEDFTGYDCETDMCYPNFPNGADISIILDDSSSQNQILFERQKKFAKSLITAFPIGMNGFRFSVNTVSSSAPTVQFSLDTYHTNDSLVNAIDDIQKRNGTTYTHEAMNAIRNEVFKNSIKTKYVITLGDGMVSDSIGTLTEVNRMKAYGITMVAVGFGSQVLHQGLIDCATDNEHVFSPTTDDLKNWLLIRHVMEQCPDCSSRSSDVFILLESSLDLNIPQLYALLDALKILVGKMPISHNGVHVGLSTFTDSVNDRFDFMTFSDSFTIIRNIISILRESGTSNHTNALKHVRDNVFQTSNGYRQGSRKIVILFISEVISDLSKVVEQADALKSEGVIIVAVTVALTTRIDISSLLQIVSDPAYLYVIGDSIYGDVTSQYAMLSLFKYNECVFD